VTRDREVVIRRPNGQDKERFLGEGCSLSAAILSPFARGLAADIMDAYARYDTY